MIGVFGGAFNPIHTGHLLLAEYIREEFKLEKVVFVPAGKPPHKQEEDLQASQHRFNMVCKAVSRNPFFEVSEVEINRTGVTYTSDTLEELAELYPGKQLGFICGADSIINLTTWHNIHKIFEIAVLIVADRPNTDETEFQSMLRWFRDEYNAKILIAGTPLVEISSTQIRERLKNGLSTRYMVPDEVLSYIQLHKLY
ncbi:MAG: nicotinate-nucleotide adenylyltransferase [Thermoclostridium sp.]|nr:nicotinate-nucleotide adenylyltransferase [Thermoclostridium sp.]